MVIEESIHVVFNELTITTSDDVEKLNHELQKINMKESTYVKLTPNSKKKEANQ